MSENIISLVLVKSREKYLLGSAPGSWHRAPKALVSSWVARILGGSFAVMRWLWVGSWIAPGKGWSAERQGLITRMTKQCLKAWSFQAHAYPADKGEGQKMELVIDHVYVRKPPWNPRGTGFGEFSGGYKHIHTKQVTHPNSPGTEAPARETLPDITPCIFIGCLSVCFLASFNKLKHRCFPKPWEPQEKMNQTQAGVAGVSSL